MKQINLLKPSVSDREIELVTEVLKSGWWGTGPKVELFEKTFAKMNGAKYCVAVNSCTSALHLALRSLLELDHVDRKRVNIIAPALTFVSTALVGLYEGVEVRLGDIDEQNFCLDPKSVERLMDENTIAVLPVHYGGNIADIPYKNKTHVIEDCAHAGGSSHASKTGIMSCWSFHPVKNIATGDMGAITTNNKKLYDMLVPMRWCGINLDTWNREKKGYSWEYNIQTLGYKYNTNDIMAALALAQLERLPDMNKRRQKIAEIYNKELRDLPIILPSVPSESWHLYAIRVPNHLRSSLVDYLRDHQISPGVHYKPLHHYPIFTGPRDTAVVDRIYPELVSLPIHPDLTNIEQWRVVEVLHRFFRKYN